MADHLAALPGAGEEDTAAVVLWPSRDVDGAAVLLRHGLAPWAMIAARVTGAAGHGPAAPPVAPGITIRRAGPADLESLVRLGMETVRYDARFGGVIERPWTAEALRRDAAGLLAGPPAWAWLAERDGEAAGLLIAERPPEARWIAPMTGLAPVAYLLLAGVLPGQRAGGIGAALTARLHEQVRAAGVPVTLLHHVPVNPLSTPFWAQQGYRPLWISWEARPAAAIR